MSPVHIEEEAEQDIQSTFRHFNSFQPLTSQSKILDTETPRLPKYLQGLAPMKNELSYNKADSVRSWFCQQGFLTKIQMQNKLFEQETGVKPQMRFDGVRRQTIDLLQQKSGF